MSRLTPALLFLTAACASDIVVTETKTDDPRVYTETDTDVPDSVTDPEISYDPKELDFGYVQQGTDARQQVIVRNEGDGQLDLSNLALTGSSTFSLEGIGDTMVIAPGAFSVITVVFTPSNTLDTATFSFQTNDTYTTEGAVTMQGTGANPAMQGTPNPLSFPDPVILGDVAEQSMYLLSTGNTDVTVSSITPQFPDDASGAYEFVGVTFPVVVGRGQAEEITVRFTPTESRLHFETFLLETDARIPPLPFEITALAGAHPTAICRADPELTGSVQEEVTFYGENSYDPGGYRIAAYDWEYTSVPQGSNLVMPPASSVVGVGNRGPIRPDALGVYEATLVVENEIGLRSEPCVTSFEVEVVGDGRPIAVCSADPPRVVALHETATWIGSNSFDPAGLPLTYAWSLITAPGGSNAVMPGGDADRGPFAPDVLGTYEAMLTVDNGVADPSDPCIASLEAEANADLWVEMFWSRIHDDMDLHLIRNTGARFSGQDCNWTNCPHGGLRWGASGTADDPFLDLDDISGDGPENINLARPEDGVSYLVETHDHPSFTSNSPTDVTVRIHVNGTLQYDQTRTVTGDNNWETWARIDWAGGIGTVTPQ